MDTSLLMARKTSVGSRRCAALFIFCCGAALGNPGDELSISEHSAPDLAPPRITVLQMSVVPAPAPAPLAALVPAAELVGVSYRWWLTNGRSDVGIGLGALGYRVTPPGASTDSRGVLMGAVPMMPMVTLGWRYRMSGQSVLLADASGALGLGANGRDGYVTKVGVEWKARSESRFGLDGSSLGFQLDSGVRMSLRWRKGGLSVYFRSQF